MYKFLEFVEIHILRKVNYGQGSGDNARDYSNLCEKV